MMFGTNKATDETVKLIPSGTVGVELGVWKGYSSEKFLTKARFLHLVDPWSVVAYEDSDEFGDYEGYLNRYSKLVGSKDVKEFQKYYDTVAESVRKKFENAPVTIHRCTTDKFFQTFNEQVDWVYVDALHSFEGCLSDLRNSLKIVKKGGLILGDDYGNKAGVVKAVDHFVKETQLPFSNFYLNQFKIEVI